MQKTVLLCDVCGGEFRPGDRGWGKLDLFEMVAGSMILIDVCPGCLPKNLVSAYAAAVEKRKGNA